jgi:uncharacterized RDD family membrane protein YckC
MSSRYCPECGSYIEEADVQFCPHCGASLDVAATAKAEEPRPTVPPLTPPPSTTPEEPAMYGEFGERFVAYIIDGIIVWVITLILSIPFLINDNFFFASGFISWLIGFLYFWLLESYNDGQTIGKKAMKLRTVDEQLLTVSTPGNYLINNLSRGSVWIIIDLIIGLIANSGDAKKRYRILQNLSKTVVIKTT